MEVLLDGASAIYGADAVAGVVNTVLKDDLEGFALDLTYGNEDGASADEITAVDAAWHQVGRWRDAPVGAGLLLLARSDLRERPRFLGQCGPGRQLPADWAANATASAGFNNTSITSAWGVFDKLAAGNILVNGTAVTNAAGPVPYPARPSRAAAPTVR